jgi:hypothetical protein
MIEELGNTTIGEIVGIAGLGNYGFNAVGRNARFGLEADVLSHAAARTIYASERTRLGRGTLPAVGQTESPHPRRAAGRRLSKLLVLPTRLRISIDHRYY